jgi:D-glycero-D-manno-heptose 1,7-bisphosphate phosphatase
VKEVAPIHANLEFLAKLTNRDTRIHVISNQSGVGRGLISNSEHHFVNLRFREIMANSGMRLSSIKYCLHAPSDGCICRKLKTYLLEKVSSVWHIKKDRSLFIGDKDSDYETGVNFGCYSFKITPNNFVLSEWEQISSLVNNLREEK